MMDADWLLWLLLLLSAIGAGCFYAGWRSCAAYLSAAKSVNDISMAAASQSATFKATLDKWIEEAASLRAEVRKDAELTEAVRDAIEVLYEGFKGAGLVRSAGRAAPGPQVGEKRGEQGGVEK